MVISIMVETIVIINTILKATYEWLFCLAPTPKWCKEIHIIKKERLRIILKIGCITNAKEEKFSLRCGKGGLEKEKTHSAIGKLWKKCIFNNVKQTFVNTSVLGENTKVCFVYL